MTAALYDEVVTATTAPTLHVVRDVPAAPATKKAHRVGQAFVAANDPLVDGAARLLSVPLRHVYAALWRIGVLEIQA